MAKATIIGAGIVGLSAAYYLQQDGWDVTVLEKGDLSDNCSFGNMGYLSPSHIVPLAAPGMIEQGIVWMFDQKSPFYVRPSLNWQLIDWGLKFMRNCTQSNIDRGAKPLLDLLVLSRNLFFDWAKHPELQFDLQQKGCVMYYKTDKKKKAELEAAKMATDNGLKVDILDREGAQALEPELTPDVIGGVMYQDDAHLYPTALMQQLPGWLEQRGVKILRNTEVTGFERQGRKIAAAYYKQAGQSAPVKAESDLFILAAGSWSPQVAKLAGEYIAMMPGKGYSMTFDNPGANLNYPCIFLEAKVALTPWQGRTRIGSTMEIGAINDKILLPRAQGILEAVPRFMPGFNDNPAFRALYDRVVNQARTGEDVRNDVWFGFRPVSADGLPYIGHAPKSDNLIVATGHAMIGLSMGTGTGKVVAELAAGKPTSTNIDAFAVGRFG